MEKSLNVVPTIFCIPLFDVWSLKYGFERLVSLTLGAKTWVQVGASVVIVVKHVLFSCICHSSVNLKLDLRPFFTYIYIFFSPFFFFVFPFNPKQTSGAPWSPDLLQSSWLLSHLACSWGIAFLSLWLCEALWDARGCDASLYKYKSVDWWRVRKNIDSALAQDFRYVIFCSILIAWAAS